MKKIVCNPFECSASLTMLVMVAFILVSLVRNLNLMFVFEPRISLPRSFNVYTMQVIPGLHENNSKMKRSLKYVQKEDV